MCDHEFEIQKRKVLCYNNKGIKKFNNFSRKKFSDLTPNLYLKKKNNLIFTAALLFWI